MRFEELPHEFKVNVIEILLNQDYGAESLVTYLENKYVKLAETYLETIFMFYLNICS